MVGTVERPEGALCFGGVFERRGRIVVSCSELFSVKLRTGSGGRDCRVPGIYEVSPERLGGRQDAMALR